MKFKKSEKKRMLIAYADGRNSPIMRNLGVTDPAFTAAEGVLATI